MGNTCYYNSVVQCLAATPPLYPSLTHCPPSPSPLTTALSSLLRQMASPSPSPALKKAAVDSTLNPSSLLTEIAKTHPAFKGNRQQDSHELLKALLGGIVGEGEEAERKKRKEELVEKIEGWGEGEVDGFVKGAGMGAEAYESVVKAMQEIAKGEGMEVGGKWVVRLMEGWGQKEGKKWRKAMTEALTPHDRRLFEGIFIGLAGGRMPSPPVVDEGEDGEGEGEEVRGGKVVMGDTAIHRVFAGVLENAVKCCACGHTSRTEEVFFDLSLPIEPPRPPIRPVVVEAMKGKGPKAPVKGKGKDKGKEVKEETAEERETKAKQLLAKEQKEEEERRHLLLVEEMARGTPVTLMGQARRKRQQPGNLGKKKGVSKAQKKLMKKKGKKSKKEEDEEEEEGKEEGREDEEGKEEGEEEEEGAPEEGVKAVEVKEEASVLSMSAASDSPPREEKEGLVHEAHEEKTADPVLPLQDNVEGGGEGKVASSSRGEDNTKSSDPMERLINSVEQLTLHAPAVESNEEAVVSSVGGG